MIAVRRLLDVRAVGGFYQPLAGEDLRPRGVYEGAVGRWRPRRVSRRALSAELDELLEDIESEAVAIATVCAAANDADARELLCQRHLPVPGHLLGGALMQFTPEQTLAIERRRGELLLDAGAGSGKTSVLVERFARAVKEDGIAVGQILTITFTEKAAAELRERIRTRLRAVGDDEAARATEGAWISTIHAFCSRLLRSHALAAGLDPEFVVLDENNTAALRRAAFDGALTVCARTQDGSDLIAAHGTEALRRSITAIYDELRSRGQLEPRLPAAPLPPSRLDVQGITQLVQDLALLVQRELGGKSQPGKRVSRPSTNMRPFPGSGRGCRGRASSSRLPRPGRERAEEPGLQRLPHRAPGALGDGGGAVRRRRTGRTRRASAHLWRPLYRAQAPSIGLTRRSRAARP